MNWMLGYLYMIVTHVNMLLLTKNFLDYYVGIKLVINVVHMITLNFVMRVKGYIIIQW